MASSHEKVIAYHISRLSDRKPDVQMNAINELVALGKDAEAALPALKNCYETAEDEEVSKAAQQAGYAIYMAVKEAKDAENAAEDS